MNNDSSNKVDIPICEKLTLSVEEASAYSGIGVNRIREMMKEEDCDFVLKIGCKKSVIKRARFERYLLAREAI